jgi:hypothetical protein
MALSAVAGCTSSPFSKSKNSTPPDTTSVDEGILDNPLLLVDDPMAEGATLVYPTLDATISSDTVVFAWNTVSTATQYAIGVGTSSQSVDTSPWGDIAYQGTRSGQITVTGIPANGQPFFVRLWTKLPNKWVSNSYMFRTKVDELKILIGKLDDLEIKNKQQAEEIKQLVVTTKDHLAKKTEDEANTVSKAIDQLLGERAMIVGKYVTDTTPGEDIIVYASDVIHHNLYYQMSLFGSMVVRFACDENYCTNVNSRFSNVIIPISKTSFFLSGPTETKRYDLADPAEVTSFKPLKVRYTCDATNYLQIHGSRAGVGVDTAAVSIGDQQACVDQARALSTDHSIVNGFTQIAVCSNPGPLTKLSIYKLTSLDADDWEILPITFRYIESLAACTAAANTINSKSGLTDQVLILENTRRQTVAFCSNALLFFSSVYTKDGISSDSFAGEGYQTASAESCQRAAKDITEKSRMYQGIVQTSYCRSATQLDTLIWNGESGSTLPISSLVANCDDQAAVTNKIAIGRSDQVVNSYHCDSLNRVNVISSRSNTWRRLNNLTSTAEGCARQVAVLQEKATALDSPAAVQICTSDSRINEVTLDGYYTGIDNFFLTTNQSDCLDMAELHNKNL